MDTKNIRHIHLTGICGTGMASLAGLLRAKGYQVTGSDENVYPPMSTQLAAIGIEPQIGYKPKNLHPRPDLVIIGNVIRRDNPEALSALSQEMPYMSMPEATAEFFLKGKETVVITGTHGKTTSANIAAWLLDFAGEDPGFLIGGVGLNFGQSFRCADGRYFVVEGDEYDTAFFDKGPKFLHYMPRYTVIGTVEFDHADIYKNIDEIKGAFSKFVRLVPANGICAGCADSPNTMDVLSNAGCRVVTFGFSENASYRISLSSEGREGTSFLLSHGGREFRFDSPLSGRHNALNAASVIALFMEMGFEYEALAKGLGEFRGVKRRQETRGAVHGITVIDDFAHHPTAIRETIRAMRGRFPEGRIFAIFEPRSNTSRRRVFEGEFVDAFEGADTVIIADVYRPEGIPAAERLDPEAVVIGICKKGGNAHFVRGTDFIVEYVVRSVLPGDTIVVMSNGAFDGIHEKLLAGLARRRFV